VKPLKNILEHFPKPPTLRTSSLQITQRCQVVYSTGKNTRIKSIWKPFENFCNYLLLIMGEDPPRRGILRFCCSKRNSLFHLCNWRKTLRPCTSGTSVANGKSHKEIVYGITSLSEHKANPEKLLTLIRGHWTIENRLHYVRDVTFDEDRCRIRKGNGAHAMASIRNLVISLLRMAGAKLIPPAIRACSRMGNKVLRFIGIKE